MGAQVREETRNLVFTVRLLRYFGMWPTVRDGWGYNVYCILMALNYYALMALMLSVVFSEEGNAHSIMKNICFVMSMVPRGVAVLSILLRRREYRVLVASIQGSTSGIIHDDLYDDDELPFRAASHFERIVSRCYCFLLMAGTLCYMLLPLTGTSGRSQMPLTTYHLLDRADPASFAVEYLLQVCSMFAANAIIVPFDLFEFFAMKYCAHQFQAIAVLLSIADDRKARPRDHGSKVGSEPDIAPAPSPGGDGLDETWHSLIRYHQSILENAERLANLFSPLLFADYVTVSIAICLLLYQIAMSEVDAELVTIVTHFCTVFVRLYIICYYGSELTHQSLLVADAACSVPWYGYSGSTKRSLCILVCRAQRPVLLMAGSYGVMSLETFSSLLQGAYSYYNILKQFNHS